MKHLVLSLALVAAVAQADVHTATNGYLGAQNWYHHNDARNWLNESGENELPSEGDDLVLAGSLPQRAADLAVYMNSVTIRSNFGGNIAWNGFYLKAGGAGFRYEGTGNLNPSTAFYLDGAVTLYLVGNMSYASSGTLGGRGPSNKGRFVKTGPGTLSFLNTDANVTGGTIREGAFELRGFTGLSALDFHFDGSASSAYLNLPSDLTLVNGGLTSTTDLPKTSHGVKGTGTGATLSITGTPKETVEYFAGSFTGTASFRFAPDSADRTFTFARAVSDAQGGLAVDSGTVLVTDGASFTSLTGLTVKAGAKLKIESGAGHDFSANTMIVEDATATVELGSGVRMTVVNLNVAGTSVPAGLYWSGSGQAWLQGEGELLVLGGGGTPSTATWTGAGADTKLSTAQNWEGSKTPDLDGGCVTATFATGCSAEVDRRSFFAGLLLSNGFAFTGSKELLVAAGGVRFADAAAATAYSISGPLTATTSARYYVGTNVTLNLSSPFATLAGAVPTIVGSGAVTFNATSATSARINLNGDTLPAGATDKSPKPGVYTSKASNALGGAGGTTYVDLMASKLIFEGDQVHDRAFQTTCAKNDKDYGISLKNGNVTFNAKVEHVGGINLRLHLTRGKTATFNAELKTSSALYCDTSWGSSGYA